MKQRQSLEEILFRASAVMYPDKPPTVIAVDSRDVDGDTPLHKAVMWGDRYAVQALIEAGAQVDAQGDMGCTPLYLATLRDDVQVAQTLLNHGANPDIPSELGGTPRSLASDRGNSSMVAVFRVRPNNSFKPKPLRGSA